MQKWSKSLSVINENTDKLNSAEQDAIKTLCNLWRRERFGASCNDSVERMVKILLDNENAHGGSQLPLKGVLKDFRSISKELYTKDEETFKQFASAAKDLLGGPQRTEEQQQRRQQTDEQRRQEAEQREAQQQRQREAQREREARQQRQREAQQQHEAQQQRQREAQQQRETQQQRQREAQQQRQREAQRQRHQNQSNQARNQGNGSRKMLLWGGIGVAVLAVVVGITFYLLSDSSDKEDQQWRMTQLLKGTWSGEFDQQQAQLSIDSVTIDSVWGQISVKFRRTTERHDVAGTIEATNSVIRLSLDDRTAQAGSSDNLNGSYKLLLDTLKGNLVGTYTNYESQKNIDLRLIKDGNNPTDQKVVEKPKKKKTKKAKQESEQTVPVTEEPLPSESEDETPPATPEEQSQPDQNSQQDAGTGFKLERIDPDQIPL